MNKLDINRKLAVGLLKQLRIRFHEDQVAPLAAQLTYYLILSFFPFLIFLISLSSFTLFDGLASVQALARFMPNNAYNVVEEVLQQIVQGRNGTILSVGMLSAIWLVSRGVSAIIRALNKAYEIEETRPFLVIKGVAILSTLALVIAIMFSFPLLIFGRMIGEFVFSFIGLSGVFVTLWSWLRHVVSLAILMLVFLFLYKYTPNLALTFKEVVPGAIFTVGGWLLVSFGFSYYVNHFGNYSATYGSLGGLITLLVWLYFTSMIVLIGGELNAALAFRRQGLRKERSMKY